MRINPKPFIIGAVIGVILLFAFLTTLPDNRLHLVFCSVGQGDASYIQTPSNQDILIDGGPDNQVLSCLGRHMPFYDRTIDAVVLTHPNKDHYQGLVSVLERFRVNNFIVSVVGEEDKNYQKLMEVVKKKKIPFKNLYLGDKFSLGSTHFAVLWPEKQWVAAQFSAPISDLGSLGDLPGRQAGVSVLGLSTTSDLNNFSYLLHLSYGSFDTLFTGDADSRIQTEILSWANVPQAEVLKFPHHGSKYGVLDSFLEKTKPELAVISVGRNPHGHPAPETLKQLADKAIKLLRTDQKGDVEIVSDGEKWWVK